MTTPTINLRTASPAEINALLRANGVEVSE